MPAGDNIARFTNGLDMMGQQALGFRDPQGPQEADTKAARDAAIQAAVDLITGVMATDAEVAAAVSFAVSAHEADTSNVHGIADTTVLATNTSVATAVSNAITALALGTAAQKNHGTGSADLPTVSHVSSLISTAINALVNGAPGLLDTLDELAQALGDDPNFAATITTALAGKAPLSHTHPQSEVTGLVAALAALLPLAGGVLTGPTTTAPVALADAATIAVNAGLGNLFRVTITANRTLGSPTGGTDGQVIRVEVAQNATGGWTLGYGAKYLGSDDLPLPAIAAGPSKRTVLTFEFDQAADKWLLLGKNAGYQL